jgi:stage V sporulation protein B
VQTGSSLEIRDGLGTVTRGTLIVAVAGFLLVVFTFFSRVLLVRSPAADWNSFSLELTYATILSTVGTLGLPNAVARALPHASSDAQRRTIVRTSILATLAASVALVAAIWLTAPALARDLGIPDLRLGFQFFSVAIAAALFSGLLAAIFRGYAEVLPNALFVQIGNPALFLLYLVVAAQRPFGGITYTSALVSYVAATATTLGLFVLYAVRRLPHRLPAGPHAPESRGELLRFTAPLFVSAVALVLAGQGDTVVLSAYHSTDVGLYTASLTLARLLGVGVSSAAFIFLPVATRFLRRENPEGVRVMYATITKWLLAISIPLVLLFVLVPQRSLGFVYGPSYSTVVLPLQLSVLGAFTASVLGPAAATLIAFGRVRLVAINSVVCGAVDLGVALALVPTLGYVGSAVAWGLATALYAGLSIAELAIADGVHPFRRDYAVPFVTTAVPAALIVFLFRAELREWMLPPLAIAIGGAFVLSVFVTRSIDQGDRLLLQAVEGMLGRPVPLVRRLARWARPR